MSLFTDDITSEAITDHFDHFAETVTRYPLGVVANSEPVTAIFIESKPVRDTSRGEEVVRKGELHVKDSVTVDEKDQWLINSELWQTLAVGGVEGGMRILQLQRNDPETRGLGTNLK